MSKRLEDFIKENRKQFDEFEVPEGLWDKIETQLNSQPVQPEKKERVVKLSLLIKMAACIVVAISAGLIYLQYHKKNAADLSAINPKLAKEQVHYASLIKEKRSTLKQVAQEVDPQLYKEFSSDLKLMEENYKKLKKDLNTSPNKEETVKAMIRNLQVQSQVLNQQLEIIKEVNKFKKGQSNETHGI